MYLFNLGGGGGVYKIVGIKNREAFNNITNQLNKTDMPLISRKYHLLRFSQTCKLSSSKAAFTIAFFAAVNHNYDHK